MCVYMYFLHFHTYGKMYTLMCIWQTVVNIECVSVSIAPDFFDYCFGFTVGLTG